MSGSELALVPGCFSDRFVVPEEASYLAKSVQKPVAKHALRQGQLVGPTDVLFRRSGKPGLSLAEIGLRRAIGATRGHIALQFLFESAAMGVIGGIIGASLGVLVVVLSAPLRRALARARSTRLLVRGTAVDARGRTVALTRVVLLRS